MKITPVVLISSLVVNGVLACAYLSLRAGRATTGDSRAGGAEAAPGVATRSQTSQGDAAAAAAASNVVVSGQVESLGILFRSGNGEELARVLRAAGVSEDMIRALVREQIQTTYRARIRAIEEAARGDLPWWQNGRRIELAPEQRAEIRGLQRALRAELDRVLGPDEARGRRAGTYAFLPADKAEAARHVDADYAEMARELRDRMEDFRLPSDREALRLLEEERRTDLAALLSPEELLGLEMRTSSVSSRLRRELGTVVASEEEFRQIYQLGAAFDAQYGRDGAGQSMSRDDRNAAEAALRQQIMDMLGPERTAVLARQRDPDYRTMQAAATRLNLPPTAVDTVFAARSRAAAESQRISADTALDAGAKRVQLGALASEVRSQLQATMGQEGAEAFAQRADWVRGLEEGVAFSLRPEGGVTVHRRRGGGG